MSTFAAVLKTPPDQIQQQQHQQHQHQQQQHQPHNLESNWVLWAHNPTDAMWELSSYIKLAEFETIEHVIIATRALTPMMTRTCMLFMMRKGVTPRWEDSAHCNGGAFSYKVPTDRVHITWCTLMRVIAGNSLGKTGPGFGGPKLEKPESKFGTKIDQVSSINNQISGASISAKRGSCIIKVWMKTKTIQDPKVFTTFEGLIPNRCLFKSFV